MSPAPPVNPFAPPAVRAGRTAALPAPAPVRMDVAAFVGRVRAGTPAAVDSPEEFSAAFREAPDSRLGPAVRAFFRNGGRRCWIVPADPPFFDNRFASTEIATLVRDAALLDDPLATPRPGETLDPPTGVHAVLALEEVTLLAVPDAFPPRPVPVLSGPDPAPGGSDAPPTPAPGFKTCVVPDPAVLALSVTSTPHPDTATGQAWQDLSWDWQLKSTDPKTAADWGATRAGAEFVLERATTNAFFPDETETIYRGTSSTVSVGTEPTFYRVRAETPALVGGWAAPPPPPVPPAAPTPGNEDPVATQVAAVKVCAARGDVLAVLFPPEDWPDIPSDEWITQWAKDDAKGVPTNDWIGVVQKARQWLSPEEPAALRTHAAFWGPWVLMRDGEHPGTFAPHDTNTPAQRLLPQQAAAEPDGFPADGSVCGLLARRAIERGAWASILNRPLAAALGVGPPLSTLPPAGAQGVGPAPYGPGAFVPLFAAEPPASSRTVVTNRQALGINVLARTARGIVPVGEYTASAALPPEFVSVRRYMVQLRRELLRAGAALAFAPNGPAGERRATRVVESILELMLRGGAFVGPDARSSFQVTARAGGPDTDAENQLVVEVRVRLARPLRVLTLRLIRSDDGSFSIAEGQS